MSIFFLNGLIFRSKTPGGKLVFLYPKKPGSVPKCGDCKEKLRGVSDWFKYKVNCI